MTPTSAEARCVYTQAQTSPSILEASPTKRSPLLPLGGAFPVNHITSVLPSLSALRGPGVQADPSAHALPCSDKVGAGLAVQSVAVTSTAQKRRYFQLHIPVLQLEVGDQAPHLHGDSVSSLIFLCKLTLGKEINQKVRSVCMGGVR